LLYIYVSRPLSALGLCDYCSYVALPAAIAALAILRAATTSNVETRERALNLAAFVVLAFSGPAVLLFLVSSSF